MRKRPDTFDGVVIDESADIQRAMSQVRDYGRRYPFKIMVGVQDGWQFMISVPGTETAAVDLRVLKPRRRQGPCTS